MISYTFSLYYSNGKDMILNDILSRMEGGKSDPYVIIPISLNSHSILTEHYHTSFNMPSETYRVVKRSQTKAVETQMPKVHWVDKVVNPALKPKTQARREWISKPLQVEPNFMPQPQGRVPQVLPRKGQGRVDDRRKVIGPRLQPIPQPQSEPASHLQYLLYQNPKL